NVRCAVAVCLGMINAGGSVPVLLQALDDTEEWVRFSAVEGLGLSGDPRALGPLLAIIERGTGSIVEAAVEALSRIASSDGAAMLLEKIEGLIKSGRLFNISAVAELLEKAQAPGSNFKPSRELKESYFEFFSNNLDDSERAVQTNALKGLGLLRLPEGLKRVIEFAESQKEMDEETESLIVDSIVSITGRGPLPAILQSELKKRGKSFRPVVKALSEIKSEAAVPLLEEAIDKVSKHEQRDVVNAIASIGSPASLGALKKCLGSADGHTRKIAARALASIAGDGAVESLMAVLMKEVYRDVMEEITDSLATIPSEPVRRGFGGLLESEREILREMGARGLGLIGDDSAVELLRKAVKDPSPAVRKTAYQSIARLGIPDTADIVISGLDDADDGVRRALLKALNGWPCDNIRDGVVKALNDRNLWARRQAVILVGDICGAEFEETIIEMLEKDEPPVKAAAACALVKIGTPRSVPVLERFLHHPDPSVRAAVENALGSMRC
ncbi:MAG: HEAT repeat domain-containing protein, partial [Deltaproteobacteria bacterium]|nr:HEAT repeat domain-containing protein [Deltaproteobacteria bacterium]